MPAKAANRIGRRAPLNLRTTDELRARLESAASEAGRSLTQEVERRLEQSFVWETAHKDAETMLARLKEEMKEIERGNLEGAMRRQGWTPMHGYPDGKAWFAPGITNAPKSGFIDPAEIETRRPDFTQTPPREDALGNIIYHAVVRALRDARQESEAGA